jgi:hypothetical protein
MSQELQQVVLVGAYVFVGLSILGAIAGVVLFVMAVRQVRQRNKAFDVAYAALDEMERRSRERVDRARAEARDRRDSLLKRP